MGLFSGLARGATSAIVSPIAGGIERVLVARQVTRQKQIQERLRTERAEIKGQSRAVRLAMAANGLAGIWYPVMMLSFTGLAVWAYVLALVTLRSAIVSTPDEALGVMTEDEKFVVGQLAVMCAALTAFLLTAGGFARYRDMRLRERGLDDREGVSDKLHTLEQLRGDATPAPVEPMPPIHRRTTGIAAAPEILAERRAQVRPRIDMDAVAREIERDEGRVHAIYPDPKFKNAPTYAGKKLTFGVGHLIRESDPEWGQKIGTAVSPERVEAQFRLDLHAARSDARRVFEGFDTLPREVQHVLINASFQLGRTKLGRFVETRKAVAARDWTWMARELRDSDVWRDPLTNTRWERHATRIDALAASPDRTPA